MEPLPLGGSQHGAECSSPPRALAAAADSESGRERGARDPPISSYRIGKRSDIFEQRKGELVGFLCWRGSRGVVYRARVCVGIHFVSLSRRKFEPRVFESEQKKTPNCLVQEG